MADYQIIVKDKNGTSLGEFTQWSDLEFSDRLNYYGECSFKVPVTSDELLNLTALRRYEVYIMRNKSTVWSGEQVARSGTLKANDSNKVTIFCRTFFEMLNSRYTGVYVNFDNTDEGTILKSLVDTSQALTDGDLGFTFGQYTTGNTRDREYSNHNIMQAFVNMSELIDGPDFYITHDKEINIVSHKGIDKSKQTVLEYGTNLESVEISEDFTNPGNQAIVLGSGFGLAQQRVTRTDTSARSTYKLRQQLVSATDIPFTDMLNARGDAVVRKQKNSLQSLNIIQVPNTNPKFGSISLGDSIRIRVQEGIYNINNNYRVHGYSVSVDENNKESISYLVGLI